MKIPRINITFNFINLPSSPFYPNTSSRILFQPDGSLKFHKISIFRSPLDSVPGKVCRSKMAHSDRVFGDYLLGRQIGL